MERTGISRSCIRRPLIKRCSGSWSLAAAPVALLAAGSEIVALARQAAVPDNGQCIPDEADREGSLASLATATAADMGSGWPEREPHDGRAPSAPSRLPPLTAHRNSRPGATSREFTRPSARNQRHLMIVLREYEDFYSRHRPHRILNQAAPLRPLPDGITDLDQFRVQRRDCAGGVIHEYRLVAQVFGTHRCRSRPRRGRCTALGSAAAPLSTRACCTSAGARSPLRHERG